jgi:hypothetical protein
VPHRRRVDVPALPPQGRQRPVIGPHNSLLIGPGEIVATSANRFGLGGVERRDVVLDGGHVLRGALAVVEQILGLDGAQEVGPQLGLVERDRVAVTHVGHQREVQQLGDVEFVLEPARIGAAMLIEDTPDRAPLGR